MKPLMIVVMGLFFTLVVTACGASLKQEIRTQDASEQEITGTYNVVLYGGIYAKALETVAILAKDDSPYTIVPYAPEFDYKIIKNLPAKEALATAYDFISRNPNVTRPQLAKIIDSGSGRVIGYEVRPLYQPFVFGASDLLNIYYWREGGKVFVRMWLLRKDQR